MTPTTAVLGTDFSPAMSLNLTHRVALTILTWLQLTLADDVAYNLVPDLDQPRPF